MLFRSPILTQASGSVGGLTFSRNRGGMYIRGRAIPTDPATSQQLARRNAVASASSAWRQLSAATRAAWDTYAKHVTVKNALGDPIELSGQQHYVRYATVYRLAFNTNPTTAPTTTTLGEPSTVTVADVTASAALTDISINFANSGSWRTNPNARLIVQLGLHQGPGVSFNPRRYRFARAISGNATTPPTNESFTYTQTWPSPLVEGNRLWLRFRVLDIDASVLSEMQEVGPVQITA